MKMKFNYFGNKAYLTWYTQNLITASLDTVYGKEVLCRGFLSHDNTPIPMVDLVPFLFENPTLLLNMTCQQIQDITQFNTTNVGQSTSWINIAGSLIEDENLFKQLCNNALEPLRLEQRHALVLEICENDIKSDIVLERVRHLKNMQFMIAMDDFGSGYSNLSRLSQTPFDIIKLDIKLIERVPTDIWATSFYREIVNLCSSTGCIIVAEGIETTIQSDFVRWSGVDLIQGFLYALPQKLSALPSTTFI